MIFNGKKAQEKGSIMLEVIAVLALMGVMGAMLFRQIYLRNQELHNVQMASEMRTVKEAFSAALQARAQEVLDICPALANTGEVKKCKVDKNFAATIKQYLPDGWFATSESGYTSGTGDASETELLKYYNFYIFVYKQEDSSQKVKIYGMVVPQEETLPATGWNFKRAARVALLIGADGGAYGPDITKEGSDSIIAGALGTWSLSADGIDIPKRPSGTGTEIPTYVAITGLDVFTPEYDVPEIKLKFPDNWDLQLQQVNVYKTFTVGNNASNCVGTIKHNKTISSGGVYETDVDDMEIIGSNCLPSFWVDAGEESSSSGGNVYVLNDLYVGYDTTNPKTGAPAIKLTKGGAIIFAQKDPDPQNASDSTTPRSYVLDPAYTSVMNDIKLTSRGGARLSDILPNYILKTQEEISTANNKTISKPSCPVGYKKALVILPTIWDKRGLTMNVPALDIPAKNEATKSQTVGVTTNSEGKQEVTIPKLDIVAHTTTKKDGVDGINNDTGICVKIGSSTVTSLDVATGTEDWTVTLGKRSGENCTYDASVKAIAQTYCVFDESTTVPSKDRQNSNSDECGKMGGTFNSSDRTCSFPKVS